MDAIVTAAGLPEVLPGCVAATVVSVTMAAGGGRDPARAGRIARRFPAACYTQHMPENSGHRHGAFDALVAAADAPIYLVTVAAGGQRAGCLVGFASQVAIEPARFLICLSKANHTYRLARYAEFVAVHLAGTGDTPLATLFGGETGDEMDKFAHCSWRTGPYGVPVLDAAAAWFCGRVLARHDFGDHVGLVLEPEEGEVVRPGTPALRYHHVADLEPGHPA
ncbi:flavin reductase family protein [Nocardia sp. CA-290969]|uniref:flavin reductase family protein n=1 Tax=Nocardia sp. CA-290969 TaxID=3239986 RepID=UPI003D918257